MRDRNQQEKGIKNKKRERMVWDDEMQQWRPRYGYKRAYDETDMPIMEVKAGQDPYADPWEAKRQEKKARIEKNERNRERNEERAGRRVDGMKSGIPVDLAGSTHKGKSGVQKALTLAQNSTASMGKFDVKAMGEPEQRKVSGTRKAQPNNDLSKKGVKNEAAKSAKILSRVLTAAENPQMKLKGRKGERIEAGRRSREYHPLDDAPYENVGGGEAGSFKKKKGRAGAGKLTKMTKKRAK